jgi:inhibitor of KinA
LIDLFHPVAEQNNPQPQHLSPVGDSALLVNFGDGINLELNRRVHFIAYRFMKLSLPGVIEVVPAYNTLLVHYDPLLVDYPAVQDWVSSILSCPGEVAPFQPRRVEIPAAYGGVYGPDLEFVAAHNHLTSEEVIRIHANAEYQVYMLGFAPGFAYLGGMDAAIAVPRLEKPRTRVPAGSVGIAGHQTGIYPLETPGGWRIIGRTNLRLFDPCADPPSLLQPGDRVKFIPVEPGEDSYDAACP